MNMIETQLLEWARGTGFELAIGLFLLGTVLRLLEIFLLGRRPFHAPPADHPIPPTSTVFSRFFIPRGMLARAPVTYVGGLLFHFGLLLVVFLFAPHIQLFQTLLGLNWPGLPTPLVDFATVITLMAMVGLLASRISNPVKRFLSDWEDYLTWLLTFLPLVTGYIAFHHLLEPYGMWLAFHLLSAELLLAALPFTKLFHAVTAFSSRYYTGQAIGRKGVAS